MLLLPPEDELLLEDEPPLLPAPLPPVDADEPVSSSNGESLSLSLLSSSLTAGGLLMSSSDGLPKSTEEGSAIGISSFCNVGEVPMSMPA